MKQIVAVFLTAAAMAVGANAQSGRRIQATPTPTPKPAEEQYSESKPLPPRPGSRPTLRNVKPKETPAATPAPAQPDATDEDAIKIETDLITIPVSVFDRNGLYMAELGKENFRIYEDGKEQQIEYFATSENPVTVAIVLDTSLSTAYKIEEIQNAAIAFVDRLNPQDKVAVVEFDGDYDVLTDITSDRQKIYRAIRKADIGPGTLLYDTVDFAVRKLLRNVEGRKAIVLFTDGVNTVNGRSNYDRSIDEAEESDATIFPIYYNTFFDQRRMSSTVLIQQNTRGEYALGRQYLKDLADYTGGRVYDAEATGAGLARTFESIAEELRRQYSIGYIPQDAGTPGQRKSIKVRVNRPNLIVRARDSYIVGSQRSAK